MKKFLILTIFISPFFCFSQSAGNQTSSCDVIHKIFKLYKEGKYNELIVSNSEVKISDNLYKYKCIYSLDNFDGIFVYKETISTPYKYSVKLTKEHDYKSNSTSFTDACSPYYDRFKACFEGWTMKEEHESGDDWEMEDLYVYIFTKEGYKAELEIYESLSICKVTLIISQFNNNHSRAN